MERIRDGVWLIEGNKGGHYPFSHSLYIEGDDNVLIDTGAGPILKDLACKTKQVVLSHYHRDHVTFNHLFDGASFYIHEEDSPGVESLEGFYRLSGLGQVNIENYWKMVRQANFVPTRIDRYLTDGDYISQGRLKIKVLHLPGHTPGHCGFIIENYNLVFAVDIDLTRFGPWYGNPSSDLVQFRNSILQLRALKPDLLLTSHCRPIRKNIQERLAAFEAVLDRRDEAIMAVLQEQPLSAGQIAERKIIYGSHHGQDVLLFFEQNMIEKHLKSLAARAMVAKMKNGQFYAL